MTNMKTVVCLLLIVAACCTASPHRDRRQTNGCPAPAASLAGAASQLISVPVNLLTTTLTTALSALGIVIGAGTAIVSIALGTLIQIGFSVASLLSLGVTLTTLVGFLDANLTAALNGVTAIVSVLSNVACAVLQLVINLVTNTLTGVACGTVQLLHVLTGGVLQAVTSTTNNLPVVGGVFQAVDPVINSVVQIVPSATGLVVQLVNNVLGAVPQLLCSITGIVTGLLGSLTNGLGNTLNGINGLGL